MKKTILKLSALMMILTIIVVPIGGGCFSFGGAWKFAGQGVGWDPGLDPWGFFSGYPITPTTGDTNNHVVD